jgi:hypothetical protein
MFPASFGVLVIAGEAILGISAASGLVLAMIALLRPKSL